MVKLTWRDVRNALTDLLKAVGVALGFTVGAAVVTLVLYAIFLAVGLIAAPLVMLAWNGSLAVLFPTVFPIITYWHAFWLWVLATLLLKSTNANASNTKGNK